MNKRTFKRYNKLGTEIASFQEDLNRVEQEVENAFADRNHKMVFYREKMRNYLLFQIGTRKALRSELLLPTHVKMENGLCDILESIEDKQELTDGVIHECVFTYLAIRFNKIPYECVWKVKGQDVYISRIRWNKGQILREDVEDLSKGKIRSINNGVVNVFQSDDGWGKYVVAFKSNYAKTFRANTKREIIEELEHLNLM